MQARDVFVQERAREKNNQRRSHESEVAMLRAQHSHELAATKSEAEGLCAEKARLQNNIESNLEREEASLARLNDMERELEQQKSEHNQAASELLDKLRVQTKEVEALKVKVDSLKGDNQKGHFVNKALQSEIESMKTSHANKVREGGACMYCNSRLTQRQDRPTGGAAGRSDRVRV